VLPGLRLQNCRSKPRGFVPYNLRAFRSEISTRYADSSRESFAFTFKRNLIIGQTFGFVAAIAHETFAFVAAIAHETIAHEIRVVFWRMASDSLDLKTPNLIARVNPRKQVCLR